MFCAGYNLYFFRHAFPLNSNDFSDETFFLQLHLLLVFSSFWSLYHLIFRDISLKSQESFCFIFRCISLNIQWILFLFQSFSLNCSWAIQSYSFIYSLFRWLFSYYLSYLFKLFSYPYLFIYFVFYVLVKLC